MEGSVFEDDSEIVGEFVSIPPEALAQLPQQTDERIDRLTFLRRTADFTDVDGEVYRAGLDEAEAEPHEEAGKFRLQLNSHNKRIIIITGAALLFAAGAGVTFQRNRTQRKKMKR